MTHLKIVNASRGSIHKYEDLKRKLYKCNANIHFNKQCLKKQLTPSYANIKVPNTSPAHKYTQHKITNIRIKDEIRFLHSKKQKLNLQIYHLHISLANTMYRISHIEPFLTNFKNTSPKETENIIRSLKTKESHGYDEITTRILKISPHFISFPLTYIFNKAMITGIFPSRLKYALIKPIFKNGDKKNIANYRPISLLPSFSKILEKIM